MEPVTHQFNEASKEYRNKKLEVDTRFAYLATLSISLLLTFLGVLYQGEKDISQLHIWN